MAQIVTITNPLTGQPTQVDQLEHTAQEIDDGIGFESTDYPGCYYRMVSGVVEWFNPPMQLGEEYRTTERYLGKPVYVKIVDIGACPNTSTKIVGHGIANIDQCISASGIVTASTGDTFTTPYASHRDGLTNSCSFSRTEVRFWEKGDNSTSSAKVLIKYTKTTD